MTHPLNSTEKTMKVTTKEETCVSSQNNKTTRTEDLYQNSRSKSQNCVPVYDIANAGPRHRFTILTDLGPMIVANCILGSGYGLGYRGFMTMLDQTYDVQVEVTEAVLQGSGFVEVIRMVLREGHDIVIKAAEPLSGLQRFLFASTDQHLLRKCPCPVWMLMGPEDGCFDQIVAAIDPSAGPNDPRAALDALVLDLATGLASRDAAEVHVLHAWYLPEEQALRQGRFSKSYAGEVDMLVTREEAAARARVAEVMRPYTEVKPRNIVVRKGHPGDVVADYAANVSADVIVMGTVGRTGLNGFVMGNTAETVLNRISCAVIAVKPEGFVSPVTLGPAG